MIEFVSEHNCASAPKCICGVYALCRITGGSPKPLDIYVGTMYVNSGFLACMVSTYNVLDLNKAQAFSLFTSSL